MKRILISLTPLIFYGCGGLLSYDSGSSVETREEVQEFGDNAQVDQSTITTISGEDATVEDQFVIGENVTAEAEDSKGCAALRADGPGGFTFKPISDEDENLVILLPETEDFDFLCGVFTSETMQTENCEEQFSEDEEGRPVFRFDKPGGSYVSEFRAVKDGESCTFVIPDTSQRLDRIKKGAQ